jgi:peptide-methionine (S)-S-oxide reductase
MPEKDQKPAEPAESAGNQELAVATFGAGCFWCVEAVFQRIDGVVSVESGYTGGTTENPTYQQICSSRTGHAEACQLRYDPTRVGYEELLEVFFKTHDPTTLNRQGNDRGTQYRSAIFYHTEEQRRLAEKWKKTLDDEGIWEDPIVTEITPATKFYKAENYHQNYYNSNRYQPYCMVVIRPKIDKLNKVFKDKLKKDPGKAGN